jgi:hypothetical protein
MGLFYFYKKLQGLKSLLRFINAKSRPEVFGTAFCEANFKLI